MEGEKSEVFQISLDKICFVILKARELESETPRENFEPSETPFEELDLEALEERGEDPGRDELASFIDNLNEDEAFDLIALMWVGRGTYDADDFAEARDVARKEATHTPAEYLLGTPLLAEHLQNGLEAFDLSCGDAETIKL